MINLDAYFEKIYKQIESRVAGLPDSLIDHIERTRILAENLAETHGVDVWRCSMGAIAHDLARHLTGPQLLLESQSNNIPISGYEYKAPVLLHGPLAAHWLETDFNCHDEEVINSVRYHTTGHPGMTDIEKIVFLADKVEPDKVRQDPALELVTLVMDTNLDTSILEYLKLRIESILGKKGIVHPLAIETWNYFLQKNH